MLDAFAEAVPAGPVADLGCGPGHVAAYVSDAEVAPGGSRTLSTWWGHDVELTFRFLDPAVEAAALAEAGLATVARIDREPYAGAEHPSRRCTLLLARP